MLYDIPQHSQFSSNGQPFQTGGSAQSYHMPNVDNTSFNIASGMKWPEDSTTNQASTGLNFNQDFTATANVLGQSGVTRGPTGPELVGLSPGPTGSSQGHNGVSPLPDNFWQNLNTENEWMFDGWPASTPQEQ